MALAYAAGFGGGSLGTPPLDGTYMDAPSLLGDIYALDGKSGPLARPAFNGAGGLPPGNA
jgi:hypothetical protein